MSMKMTFRWYGATDPIPLAYIRQIPRMSGIVCAVYDCQPGEIWSNSSIEAISAAARAEALAFSVVESVPVHEDIKLGRPARDRYIYNYCENIRRLSKAGVKCICYNFMPVFDWLRTDLRRVAPDGSTSLSFAINELSHLDPGRLSLPGWDESYAPGELRALLAAYSGMSHETLFDNLTYFLRAVIPVCVDCGMNMAIHPDDPPWDIFGLPRIMSCRADFERLFAAFPEKNCGITLCTGSLGASPDNDVVSMARDFAAMGRVHFAHLRNITLAADVSGADGASNAPRESSFCESGHQCGSLDLYAVVCALADGGFDGYVRPDHGRNIWGEDGKPGYGLYDRALGAAYLNGLIEAASRR